MVGVWSTVSSRDSQNIDLIAKSCMLIYTNPVDVVHFKESAYEQALTQMELAKLVWMPLLSQFLITVGSQLVVSQYVSVPKQFYPSQTTILLYEYYIGSCLGMIFALSKRTRIGPKTLLIASIVRFALFPLTLLYIAHPTALGQTKHADNIVQVLNFIFTFTNGHLFSSTYSQANAYFKSPAGVSSHV